MWPRSLIVGALFALAAGCLSRSADPEPQRHQRFAGSWLVDQPYHAHYEATVYRFGERGRVGVGRSLVTGDASARYVTGSVSDPLSGVSCALAGSWYSADESTLVVDGNCSDGRYREIALGLSDDDDEAVVVSVAGEDGWVHDDWRWRWRRCSRADCADLLP